MDLSPVHSRSALALGALVLAFPVPTVLSATAQGQRLEDAELAPVVTSLAAYFEARDASRAPDQARVELAQALVQLEQTNGADLLRRSADLARTAWLARGYSARKVRTGKIETERFAAGRFATRPLKYAYRLPKSYDPKTRAYPLILALPDEGEDPAHHLRAHWILPALMDGAILLCPEMPEQREDWTRVTVEGRPGGLSHALAALALAEDRFAVDFDRVFVAGYGKGVPAAVAAGNYAPQRFAGIVGRAGDVGELGPANFANLPTWFSGGGSRARTFQEASEEAGFAPCTLPPGGGEEQLWAWVTENLRLTHPEDVTLAVGDPFPTRVNWLRVAPTDPKARAKASIDREKNTVSIEGFGVSHATLYLNDELLDLSKPVHVICNGVKSTVEVEPRLSTTLDLLQDGTSDPGCVFVAERVFDMSGEEPVAEQSASAEENAEYAERLTAAEGDVAALWSLYEWCETNELWSKREPLLLRILYHDPDHAAAREALGHHGSPGLWFTTQEAHERFLSSQDEATARARGYVRRKTLWMHPADGALAGKGRTRDTATGLWFTGAERRQLDKGWVRQDLAWIPPGDAHRVAEGEWLVEGEWLDLEQADRRRSRIDAMWQIPTPSVMLYSTADRATSLQALWHMARAIDDVRRVFGAEPQLPVDVVLLRDEEQAERFAIGDPDGRRRATHGDRLHLIHSAFLAESWFPRVDGKLVFRGAGVGYWDALHPYGALYGVHSARLAAALAYVDALDSSPKAIRRALPEGPDAEYYEAYLAEKELPGWLRYGGAVYAERFFRDEGVAEDADPWWARQWSLENLQRLGGLRPLEDVFAFRLDADERDDGLKLLIEAGLLCAFIVDGACEPVEEAHAKFKTALVEERLLHSHVQALVESITANEAELKAFAEL